MVKLRRWITSLRMAPAIASASSMPSWQITNSAAQSAGCADRTGRIGRGTAGDVHHVANGDGARVSPRLLPLVRGLVVAARSGGADDRLRFDLDQLGRPRETDDFHQGHRGPDVPEMSAEGPHRLVRHINIGDVDARLRTTSSSDPRACLIVSDAISTMASTCVAMSPFMSIAVVPDCSTMPARE